VKTIYIPHIYNNVMTPQHNSDRCAHISTLLYEST